ncbi:type II toxin-antitoxin system RelE/ParE family toxin [Rhizobium sp. CSW-27]|uniref:type II toxin-antitoxin system RelE/ParE family toxin n=1 Tax=Rhizobium sp. CSW-27 TaxID=2839985 RepID=UPI001C03190D|nr:type II toxin-antitoxin system RelE/ParE family toxin [Rhizobium sp. CSW-27]
MPRLVFLSSAKRDLIITLRYIAEQSGSAIAARAFVDRIRRKCRDLSVLPGIIGRPRPELGTDIRSQVFQGYVIFFRYRDDSFEVINILHGRRDIDSYFREIPPTDDRA